MFDHSICFNIFQKISMNRGWKRKRHDRSKINSNRFRSIALESSHTFSLFVLITHVLFRLKKWGIILASYLIQVCPSQTNFLNFTWWYRLRKRRQTPLSKQSHATRSSRNLFMVFMCVALI